LQGADRAADRGERLSPLVPAKAGTQFFLYFWLWIPACAGMSGVW
jgi:hypothetical protein